MTFGLSQMQTFIKIDEAYGMMMFPRHTVTIYTATGKCAPPVASWPQHGCRRILSRKQDFFNKVVTVIHATGMASPQPLVWNSESASAPAAVQGMCCKKLLQLACWEQHGVQLAVLYHCLQAHSCHEIPNIGLRTELL